MSNTSNQLSIQEKIQKESTRIDFIDSLTFSLTKTPSRLVFFGIFCLALAFLPHELGILSFENPNVNKLVQEIWHIIHEIGVAMLISATLVFSIETRHYKEYFNEIFKKQIIDLLIDDAYIKNLGKDKQEKLENKLIEELHLEGREYSETGILAFFHKRLAKLAMNCYFEEYDMTIIFDIESKHNGSSVLVKTIQISIIVANPTKQKINYSKRLNKQQIKESAEVKDVATKMSTKRKIFHLEMYIYRNRSLKCTQDPICP